MSGRTFQTEPASPLRLRPHHGMCLCFFEGRGYSQGFTAHMGEVLSLLEKGRDLILTDRCDEICTACPNREGERCRTEGKVSAYDRKVLEKTGLSCGIRLSFEEFERLVGSRILAAGLREEICGDCQWDGICRNRRSRFSEESGL